MAKKAPAPIASTFMTFMDKWLVLTTDQQTGAIDRFAAQHLPRGQAIADAASQRVLRQCFEQILRFIIELEPITTQELLALLESICDDFPPVARKMGWNARTVFAELAPLAHQFITMF